MPSEKPEETQHKTQEKQELQLFRFPLSRTTFAELHTPWPITEADFKLLIKTMETWRAALTREP